MPRIGWSSASARPRPRTSPSGTEVTVKKPCCAARAGTGRRQQSAAKLSRPTNSGGGEQVPVGQADAERGDDGAGRQQRPAPGASGRGRATPTRCRAQAPARPGRRRRERPVRRDERSGATVRVTRRVTGRRAARRAACATESDRRLRRLVRGDEHVLVELSLEDRRVLLVARERRLRLRVGEAVGEDLGALERAGIRAGEDLLRDRQRGLQLHQLLLRRRARQVLDELPGRVRGLRATCRRRPRSG